MLSATRSSARPASPTSATTSTSPGASPPPTSDSARPLRRAVRARRSLPATSSKASGGRPTDHTETIDVRGGEPVEVDVTVTRHGPIIVGDPAARLALALRLRRHHRAEPHLRGAPADAARHAPSPSLTRRSGPGSTRTTTSSWPTPTGTIGYLTRGQIPVRPLANAWLPVPGWDGEHEWQGLVPFEEMPRARNPEQGFIATANQRIVGPDFPHYISLDWSPALPRRTASTPGCARSTGATPADMTSSTPTRSRSRAGPSSELARALTPQDAASAEARDRLLAWDGVMGPADVAAHHLRRLARADHRRHPGRPVRAAGRDRRHVGRPAHAGDAAGPAPARRRLRPLMQARHGGAAAGESWESLGAQALAAAVAWLARASLGPDQAAGAGTAIHRTRPRHTLSAALPGSRRAARPALGRRRRRRRHAAGRRVRRRRRQGLHPDRHLGHALLLRSLGLGQQRLDRPAAAHPAIPAARTTPTRSTAWGEQRLHPMLYSWDRIEAAAETRQRLEPA